MGALSKQGSNEKFGPALIFNITVNVQFMSGSQWGASMGETLCSMCLKWTWNAGRELGQQQSSGLRECP